MWSENVQGARVAHGRALHQMRFARVGRSFTVSFCDLSTSRSLRSSSLTCYCYMLIKASA